NPCRCAAQREHVQRTPEEHRRSDFCGSIVWLLDVIVSDAVSTLPQTRTSGIRNADGRHNHGGDSWDDSQSGSNWSRGRSIRQEKNFGDMHGIARICIYANSVTQRLAIVSSY